jgi:Leucine-rich repeat (LRR) protein
MEAEAGDDYLRRVAQFIRNHEQSLAEGGFGPRRYAPRRRDSNSSVFNPLSWVGLDASSQQQAAPAKPITFTIDTHHLSYVLIRLEALGINVGTLDVKLENPTRPTSYINFAPSDKAETLSLSSFRSSLSAVSNLSLGPNWWGKPTPPSIDVELKYIYSSFTKLPTLSVRAPGPKIISELQNDPSNDCAIPLDSFKNLQSLECFDVDPRVLLGWDRVAESARSLTIKRGGLEDVTDVFIGLVLDDQATREGQGTTLRRKRTPRGPSRQESFHGTRLPDSVPEVSEDAHTDDELSGTPELPSWKWGSLKHLSLADNSLTFFPTAPVPYLTSVSHLDLSSNLLVSVPPGLSGLYNLVSLNLSDNMIDSVLGIYQRLGSVTSINLSKNRLESICGLERLVALERVDIRHNILDESAEIGRLAVLPNIKEVWVEGNPLTEVEEGHRIRCFDYFWKEGKTITLDGALPGFYEKRHLTEPIPEQMRSSRPASTAINSPPTVAVGSAQLDAKKSSPLISPTPSIPGSQNASPSLGPSVVQPRGRRKKNKRLVNLDGGADDSGESIRARSRSAIGAKTEGKDVTKPHAEEGPSSPPITLITEPTSPRREFPQPPDYTMGSPPSKKGSRHTRGRTESSIPAEDVGLPSLSVSTVGSLKLKSRAAIRRARATASTFEPPPGAGDQGQSPEAFRARIEALRADMGDGWLKVLNQSHMGSPGVASG